MASFNKIQIVGYLGRDPELRYTPQGTAVCDFSIATTKKFKANGEPQEQTTWFRVTAWGKQAELVSQYCEKGSQVFVEGELSQKEYTDKEGKARVSLEVEMKDVKFLGSRGDGESRSGGKAQSAKASGGKAQPPQAQQIDEDDIPF